MAVGPTNNREESVVRLHGEFQRREVTFQICRSAGQAPRPVFSLKQTAALSASAQRSICFEAHQSLSASNELMLDIVKCLLALVGPTRHKGTVLDL